MDLQDHLGGHFFFFEVAGDGNHGAFDDLSGGALYGHVDGVAFGKSACGGIAGVDVGEEAFASEEGFYIALCAGGGDDVLHVCFYLGELLEVGLYDGVGLCIWDVESLGESEGGYAVDDAEVDHFGLAPHGGGDAGGGGLKDVGGGGGVDVFSFLEGG